MVHFDCLLRFILHLTNIFTCIFAESISIKKNAALFLEGAWCLIILDDT